MESPINIKHCETTTQELINLNNLKEFKCNIFSSLENNGYKGSKFLINNNCVNLDKYEIHIAKRQKRNLSNSMDICFGIKIFNAKKILLVDFKLNSKYPKNIRLKELIDKINHSTSLLGQEIPIYNKFYFVFSDSEIMVAKNHFRRLSENKKRLISISVGEFLCFL